MNINDQSWDEMGFNKYMTKSLKSTDPNFQTGEDFTNNTENASLRSATIGGRIRAKLIIVDDGINDRVYLGKLS